MAIDCDFLAEPVNTFLGCCIPRNRWVRIWLRGPIENVASTSDLIRLLTSGFVKTDVVSVCLQNSQMKFNHRTKLDFCS